MAGAIGALDALGVAAMGWRVVWSPFLGAAVGVALLAGIAQGYRRREPALARLADTLALAVTLAVVCQVATYLVGTTGAPFVPLREADRALGFHWRAWTAWVHGHPVVWAIVATIYPLHFAASGVAVGVLALRTTDGAARFLRAFVVAFGVAVVGQLAVPAFTRRPDAYANELRHALRGGAFHTLDLSHTDGLIALPSMHAALAVLVALALWPWRRWRLPLALFTAVMLVATVSEGGHHLVDVLAGSALGGLAWRAAQ